MQLVGELHTTIVLILIVGVLVDHSDDLLLHHVVSVRLTADIERSGLGRLLALDDEVLLVVGHRAIFSLGDCSTLADGRAVLGLIVLIAVIPLAGGREPDSLHIGGIGIVDIGIDHLTTTVRRTEVDEVVLGNVDIVAVVLGLHMGVVTTVVADGLKLLVGKDGTIGQTLAIVLHIDALFLEHSLILYIHLIGVRCMEGCCGLTRIR